MSKIVGTAVAFTVAVAAAGGGYAAGTAETYVATPDSFIEGTAEFDDSIITAAGSDLAKIRAEVRIDGDPVTELLGTLTLTGALDKIERTAAFEIADRRVAFFHPYSFTNSDKDVEIDVFLGPPGGVVKHNAFKGYVEGTPSTADFVPDGQFQAVSYSRRWATTQGCLDLPAFSDVYRPEALGMFAASVGVTILNLDAVPKGKPLQRPLNLRGITLKELINGPNGDGKNGWGEIMGIWAREAEDGSGDIELVFDSDLATQHPKFTFDKRWIVGVGETPPQRPVLDWSLSTTRITEASFAGQQTITIPQSGIDANGYPFLTILKVTTDQGVELRRETMEYGVKRADGVAEGPLLYQLKGRTLQTKTWQKGSRGGADTIFYTNRLLSDVTDVYQLGGIESSASSGYAWSQGGRFTTTKAAMILVSRTAIVNTWRDDTCLLESTKTTRWGYGLPQGDPAVTSGIGSTALFPDSTYRYNPFLASPPDTYLWLVLSEEQVLWQDYRDGIGFGAPTVIAQGSVSRWFTAAFAPSPSPKAPIEKYGPVDTEVATWVGDAAQTVWTKTTTRRSSDLLLGNAKLPDVVEHGTGPVPSPPRGGADTAQFQQEVLLRNFVGSTNSGYAPWNQADFVSHAESVEELEAIYMRRARLELSVDWAINGPWVPGLREGDVIETVDSDLAVTTPKRGMLWSWQRSLTIPLDPASPPQQTTVMKIIRLDLTEVLLT